MVSSARRVTVLGSTGSVGTSTLDVLDHARRGGEEIEIVALTAAQNVDALGGAGAALAAQARRDRR